MQQLQPQLAGAGRSPKHYTSTAPLSWTPGGNVLTSSTHSMPELWEQSSPAQLSAGRLYQAADSRQCRDQGTSSLTPQQLRSPIATPAWQHEGGQQQQQLSASMPSLPVPPRQQQPARGTWSGMPQQLTSLQTTNMHQQPSSQQHQGVRQQQSPQAQNLRRQQQQQDTASSPSAAAAGGDVAAQSSAASPDSKQRVPIDVLLAPLLPSANDSKLLDRLTQLRVALDEQRRLAASWEQQVGVAALLKAAGPRLS